MQVDIWSDIRCPFCYIGKRKFEIALAKFQHKDNVEIVWHSFELDPYLKTQTDKNVHDYLAERKGATRQWAIQMHEQVTQSAKEVGLTYNFEKTVISNSFDAHRLIQLAKSHGLGDVAEERLFRAYFTEGKNISDRHTLVQLGVDIGLTATAIEEMLKTTAFTEEVRADELTAQEIGINGVPFFVMNKKYAVSGAQPPEAFLKGLEKAWAEFEKEFPKPNVLPG